MVVAARWWQSQVMQIQQRQAGGTISQLTSSGAANGRCVRCPTRSACIAAGLDRQALRRLPEILKGSEVHKPGAHLFRPGDPAEWQYHVRSGALKTYSLNAQGDERVTGFYLPGEMLSSSQSAGRRREGAVVLETATVCRMRVQDVGRLQEVDRLPMLLQKLAERETLLAEHQLNLAGTASLPRFVGFCLQYSARLARLGRCPEHLPLPMSRTDLASYLGMTLETVSRVCAKLSKSGLLRSQPKTLQLLDRSGLEALAVPGTY